MNDTRTLSMIVYSHCFFLIFRATLFVLDDGSASSELMAYRSLLISGDVIFSLATYFFPKLLESEVVDDEDDILPDLFLNSSILVADVMGFSAWSSAREPHQVFKLLETLYENFDQLANNHKVFKVETVRDCYVAATGIPDPQTKHYEIISKFAIDILKKMNHVSKKLELMFGPDTGELTIRVGIHSGPVTGGFLKGKGARFQLFGDTMSTACLIQTTGMSNRIQLSQATAKLLIDNGRKRWVQKRDAKIYTEEKGDLETYWLTRGIKDLGGFDEGQSSVAYSDFMSMVSELDDDMDLIADSRSRWIEWNVEVLAGVLKQILAQRATWNYMDESVKSVRKTVTRGKSVRSFSGSTDSMSTTISSASAMPLEEVAEIIELPAFDKKAMKRQRDNSDKKDLDPMLMAELREYVTMVAGMYRENPFHNFAHASYVVMAVSKYMNRIMTASEMDLGNDGDRQRSSTQEALHDHTYGITSDPLTRFACVFSALIHDIDHPGVPNPRLIQENERLACIYKKRSVAEQNSFDLAWELLLDDSFKRLRQAICVNDADFQRFRQIVVNSVMATDLGDKEMKALRNGRWGKAFAAPEDVQEESLSNSTNRKATIVIEHLIQAADVAHTCQHWNLYRKWNERLFQECYKAWRDGRADNNPADGWYEGEMGFYDFYIIPLAKKLRDCGVFGPTSDENLNYAKSNRAQWEKEGRGIVLKMLDQAEEEYNAAYMEESLNNLSPDSEFNSKEFHDEQIMVRFKDEDRQPFKSNLSAHRELDDDNKMDDEKLIVRFNDEHSDSKTDEPIMVRFKD
jgi:class 3 adenylate cyclase